MHNNLLKYRRDIDGLRAIAVISVVLYHAFPSLVPGGFVGVDVFFVISGFLITSILQKELLTKQFSIKKFYERRIIRLFPALLLVLVSTLFLGWALLLETEFLSLGRDFVFSALFLANVSFWIQASDYFNSASELKPLLHLWSLGVEEQFYIIWPIIIYLIYRLRLTFMFVIPAFISLSLLLSLTTTHQHQSFAFFLPFTRIWELAVGGFLAFLLSENKPMNLAFVEIFSRKYSNLSWLVGLSILIFSFFYIDKSVAFPGYWVLLPITGTVLLLVSGKHSSFCSKISANRFMVSIGLISYPLYLWHWPLMSYSFVLYDGKPPSELLFGIVVVSLLLAWLTFEFVEKPVRKRNVILYVSPVSLLSGGMVAILFFGILISSTKVPVRLSTISTELSHATRDWDTVSQGVTTFKGSSTDSVLFMGDSYVQQLSPRAKNIYSAKQQVPLNTTIFSIVPGCAPILRIERIHRDCLDGTIEGYEIANSAKVKTIVIGGSWLGMTVRGDYYLASDSSMKVIDFQKEPQFLQVFQFLKEDLQKLKNKDKEIYLILHPPGGKVANPLTNVERLSANPNLNVKTVDANVMRRRAMNVNSILIEIATDLNINVIDPYKWFCSNLVCRFSDKSGVPFFKDATHIRSSYSRDHIDEFDHLFYLKE